MNLADIFELISWLDAGDRFRYRLRNVFHARLASHSHDGDVASSQIAHKFGFFHARFEAHVVYDGGYGLGVSDGWIEEYPRFLGGEGDADAIDGRMHFRVAYEAFNVFNARLASHALDRYHRKA